MSRERWWRFLPDRSQLMLLAGVLIAGVTTVGFINLAMARGIAQAELRVQETRVARLHDQNLRLQDELARAQTDESAARRAADYFNRVQEGTTLVLPEAVPTPVAADEGHRRPSGPPYWADWWKRLAQP